MQPSDGMILVIGPRLEGHSVIFLAIQTHLSCRFLLAVDSLGLRRSGPSVEVSSSDPRARDWWAGLDQSKRRAWGRRLSDLRGPSFLVEAYRQAGTPETDVNEQN